MSGENADASVSIQTGDTIIRDAASADGYDEQARNTNWHGSEVVFGLAYEYVSAGESLLDIGIGSGLSAMPFHRAGLRVYGLDGSTEVLRVCAAKNFAEDLRVHDLRQMPLPYPDGSMDHVVAVALLNSFGDLRPLFGEFTRIMRRGGIFAFTVEDQMPGQAESYAINRVDVGEAPREELAVLLHRHSRAMVDSLLAGNDFILLKSLEFVAFHYPAEKRDVFFQAYIARKDG